jgi:replicative DNA helicase
MPDHEIKLLAYLIGGGSLTSGTPVFTNGNDRVTEEFKASIQAFGGVRLQPRLKARGVTSPSWFIGADVDRAEIQKKRAVFAEKLKCAMKKRNMRVGQLAKTVGVSRQRVTAWLRGTGAYMPDGELLERVAEVLDAPLGDPVDANDLNPVTQWLRSLGLMGVITQEKFIPPCIYQLPKPQMALFLNRLFAVDGWARVKTASGTWIGYLAASARMTRQIQHLLLRFGIIASRIRTKSWQLHIHACESSHTFIEEIGIFGKDEALTKVQIAQANRPQRTSDRIPLEIWRTIRSLKGDERTWPDVAVRMGLHRHTRFNVGVAQPTRARMALFAEALNSPLLRNLAHSDVYWDAIVSIESAGNKQVYDLTIPDTHNFIANDICVHNTSCDD